MYIVTNGYYDMMLFKVYDYMLKLLLNQYSEEVLLGSRDRFTKEMNLKIAYYRHNMAEI